MKAPSRPRLVDIGSLVLTEFHRRFPSLADCNSAAAAAPAPAIDNVLGCGSGAYKAQYGNSGFGDGSSWCDHIVNVTPFVCVQMPGQEAFTPAVFITIDNESAAGCYSEDKRNCKWWVFVSIASDQIVGH